MSNHDHDVKTLAVTAFALLLLIAYVLSTNVLVGAEMAPILYALARVLAAIARSHDDDNNSAAA